jgi:putative transposase
MSRYRRARAAGGTFFFTVTLADRSSNLLVQHVDLLRAAYGFVQQRHSFETLSICILPDHLHAVWRLPENDTNYSTRWGLIKSRFSRGVSADPARSVSKIAKRHIDYIHFNPVKHGLVARVADWPHSTFHRYVADGTLPADWGGDVREIGGRFGE